MLERRPFNREEHIFRSPQLADLLKDAIRFFNGTPVYELPPPEVFLGSGVYAIYYTGKGEIYAEIAQINRLAYNLPIYVGKAIPVGGRRGMGTAKETNSLHKRLTEHQKSISEAKNLQITDFHCRFIIIPHDEDALIPPIESAIIKQYNPLWNARIDGFGNHDPGAGRYNQARSSWDIIHPGRKWAEKLKSVKGDALEEDILKRIKEYNQALAHGRQDEL